MFETDKTTSQGDALQRFWRDLYSELWPGLEWPEDGGIVTDADIDEWQRKGVDRRLLRPNGRWIAIEEKVRKKSFLVDGMPDVSLETVSNDLTGAPGWALDPSKCSGLLAYAIEPARTCYMIAFKPLRAWFVGVQGGQNPYPTKATHPHRNPGYLTRFAPVPLNDLREALGESIKVLNWDSNGAKLTEAP